MPSSPPPPPPPPPRPPAGAPTGPAAGPRTGPPAGPPSSYGGPPPQTYQQTYQPALQPGYQPAQQPGPPAQPNLYGGAPVQAASYQPFGPPADFGQRAVATLWDLVYLWPALVAYAVATVLIVVGSVLAAASAEQGSTGGGAATAVVFVLAVLLFFAGFVVQIVMYVRNYILDQGRTGYTYGKRKVGIRCLAVATGQPPGAGSCVGRWFLHGLINQAFYLDYLWAAFDSTTKQTLTDKVLATVVVQQPVQQPLPQLAQQGT